MHGNRQGLVIHLTVGVLVLTAFVSSAAALINLEWRPSTQTVRVGSAVNIGLYAVSDSDENQLFAAADVIFSWDPAFLALLGVDDTGAVQLLFSGFPASDPYNLNETVPPQDGDGLYTAYAPLGTPAVATPDGTLLTTFQFQALAEISATDVFVLQDGGSPVGHTIVYDGTVPNLDVTGTLGGATVGIAPCGGHDSDLDGDVDLRDFAAFQICFTGDGIPASPACECVFNSDADQDVDFADYEDFELAFCGPVQT